MTELTPKQVLENWKRSHEQDCSQDELYYATRAYADGCEEIIDCLLNLIREAMKAAESVPLCSQYEVVKPLLEQALADYGERDE